MKKKAPDARPEKAAETREARLSAALRANLQRRKAQAKARKATGAAEDKA